MLANGQIYTGTHGTAGAFGWLRMDAIGTCRSCEELASGTALNSRAKTIAEDMTSHHIIKAVKEGDPEALKVFADWAEPLGRAIASLVSILDLEVVLISGGLSKDFEILHPILLRAVDQYASPVNRDTPILRAILTEKATLFGAIRLSQLAFDR